MAQESLKVENPQHTIAETLMFLEQPRPHFLPTSRPATLNLAKKHTGHSVQKTHRAIYYEIHITN